MKRAKSLFTVLLFVLTAFALAQWISHDAKILEANEDFHLMQLQDIVLSLTGQSYDIRQFNYDFDAISENLVQLVGIFREARAIQNFARGTMDECTAVISGFSMPCDMHPTLAIGFAYEKYMELVDFIADIAEIPDSIAIEPMFWGVFEHDPLMGQPIT